MTKVCSCCKKEKPKSAFGKHTCKYDGLRTYCRECHKLENKRMYMRHHDKALQRAAEYRAGVEDTEERRAQMRRYRKTWAAKNVAKVRADGLRRHARKLGQTPPWLTKAHVAEMDGFHHFCQIFSQYKTEAKDKFQVDHIVPIRGEQISGLHVPWNLQVLTYRVNVQKSNTFNPRVYPEQGACAFMEHDDE